MDYFEQYLAAGQMTLSNLLLTHYSDLGLTDTEFILFLQIDSCLQKGVNPDFDQIATNMKISTNSVYELLQALLEKKFLQIKQVEINGKKGDCYNFTLLYKKLMALEEQQVQDKNNKQHNQEKVTLFEKFESELGRLLSPFEIQLLDDWQTKDKYSCELITLALREAVLHRKVNFKYIDKILNNWQQEGIKNAVDLANHEQQRNNHFNPKFDLPPDAPPIPIYKWAKMPKGEDS